MSSVLKCARESQRRAAIRFLSGRLFISAALQNSVDLTLWLILKEYEPESRERDTADFMDDGRNQSGFSAPCSCTQGVTKRASIPLATAESRWWESGALGGRNGAMAGERGKEGWRMKGKERGSGGGKREGGNASNSGQNPSPVEKNK